MYEMIITSIVLVLVIFAIVSRIVPSIVIGLVIPLVLTIFEVIPASQAFTPLTNTTTFLIIGARVLGDACFRVG